MFLYTLIEGSLEVKLPLIWTDAATVGREVREENESEEKRVRRERVSRKKVKVREKVEKSRNTVLLPMICGSRGSKSRLAKAAGAEPCGGMRENCMPLWREAGLEVKMLETPQRRHFCTLRDVEKVRAVVAQSTFGSQKYYSI